MHSVPAATVTCRPLATVAVGLEVIRDWRVDEAHRELGPDYQAR